MDLLPSNFIIFDAKGNKESSLNECWEWGETFDNNNNYHDIDNKLNDDSNGNNE